MSIGWFDAFRENGAPTWYGDNAIPVRLDLGVAFLLWLFLTPTLAFCLILPGIRRLRALSAFCFLFSMAVGATLAVSIHYPGWHCGELRVFTAYRSHSRERIAASLGVHIGLTHVNITLSSNPLEQFEHFHRQRHLHHRIHHHHQHLTPPPLFAGNGNSGRIANRIESDISQLLFGLPNYFEAEAAKKQNGSSSNGNSTFPFGGGSARMPIASATTMDSVNVVEEEAAEEAEEAQAEIELVEEERGQLYYNERFDFDDVSGMEVSEVLKRGMPFPILRVVEYLSVDRTGFLWGKQYRLAGYYTLWALWLAFALWLLQMLLLCALPHRFGQVVLLCGLSTLFADAIYAWYTPSTADLYLVFTGPDELPHRLHFQLAACFYTTFTAGVASIALGSLLWLLEERTSFRLKTFFSVYVDWMCQQQQQQHRLSKSTGSMAELAGAAQPRRPIWWCPVPMRKRSTAVAGVAVVDGGGDGGLSTPKGSFTSLSHPEQMVGWKRRHRTVHRTAKHRWTGGTTVRRESPIRAAAIELCSRPGMACTPCTSPGGGGGRSPTDSMHSSSGCQFGGSSSGGTRSSGIQCHHHNHHHHRHHHQQQRHFHHRLHYDSQPSSSGASTRPLDELDDELVVADCCCCTAAQSPSSFSYSPDDACSSSQVSAKEEEMAVPTAAMFWSYRHRERDKSSRRDAGNDIAADDDGYIGEAHV